MRVLVTGASGFIGSHIVARLRADGFEVVGAARDAKDATRRFPGIRWISADFRRSLRAENWLPLLAGIDAVVNCAGVLQDSPRDSTSAVHVAGADALFAACERSGIRRVIQISAIGVGAELDTAFARTKAEGDAALMRRDLDWVVLRPSLVVGRSAYGGTALIRALAAFPLVVPVAESEALFQPVQLDDVAETVAFFLKPGAPAHRVLELAGPDRHSLAKLIARYRQWLGLPPARFIPFPAPVEAFIFWLGDLTSLLGWRPPMRTTARRQLARGVTGDPAEWMKLTGIVPRSLDAALAADPASVQDRWFVRLYLLKPFIIGALALFWLVTGLIALGPGRETAIAHLRAAGFGEWTMPVAIYGSLFDVLLGALIAWRATARPALIVGLAVTPVYLLLGAVLAPQLWLDPLGPMIKVLPILTLMLVALATLDDR